MKPSTRLSRAVLLGAIGLFLAAQARADLLSDVLKRGYVHCGVVPSAPGFSAENDKGVRVGFDVDLCHAIGAALFGDPAKVKLTPVNLKTGFASLQSGAVDVLTHRFTWTLSRDAASMNYTKVMTYDGQSFMVRKSSGVKKIADLNGAVICTAQGSTSELNATDYFRSHHLKFELLTFGSMDEALKAYDAKRCDAFTNDRNALAARRTKLRNPKAHIILKQTISKEPIGPMVANGQDRWRDVVFWVMNALIDAEELGVTKANVDKMKATSKTPAVQRLLGVTGDYGQKLGIPNSWAYNAIKAVGNYGEIWDRNLGPNTPIGLDRGLNNLWTKGGLMMSMPIR